MYVCMYVRVIARLGRDSWEGVVELAVAAVRARAFGVERALSVCH